MKFTLEKLAKVKLTREEFLVYVGVLVLGVLGVSSLLKLISDVNPKATSSASKLKSRSYGSGAYGV